MQLPLPEALLDSSLADHAHLFDFDGTLIPIAESPASVLVPPRLPALLSALRDRTGGAVAIISGRPIDELEYFLPVRGLALAGLHGLQHGLSGDQSARPACLSTKHLDALRPALRTFADRHSGLMIEDKGAALAIHYRVRPDLARAVRTFSETMVQEAKADLILMSGKCVEEIRVCGPDKGDALTAIMTGKSFRNRKPFYFGDDLTDEAAFRAAAQLGGIGVFVGLRERPTSALAQVASCDDVLNFIARLAGA
jgi:trehalose 6-phosphate phosphatase